MFYPSLFPPPLPKPHFDEDQSRKWERKLSNVPFDVMAGHSCHGVNLHLRYQHQRLTEAVHWKSKCLNDQNTLPQLLTVVETNTSDPITTEVSGWKSPGVGADWPCRNHASICTIGQGLTLPANFLKQGSFITNRSPEKKKLKIIFKAIIDLRIELEHNNSSHPNMGLLRHRKYVTLKECPSWRQDLFVFRRGFPCQAVIGCNWATLGTLECSFRQTEILIGRQWRTYPRN